MSHFAHRVAAAVVAACLLSAPAFAQMAEGPSLPSKDLSPNATNLLARLAYDASSSYYRYHGNVNLTDNIGHIGRAVPYVFADVDIQSKYLKGQQQFHPDRLVGTFELGAHGRFGNAPLGIYLRHMSAHNVDSNSRPRPAWEQIGARYVTSSATSDLTISVAYYTHRENNHYRSDADAQGHYRLGRIGSQPLDLVGDVHYVGETGGPRSSFLDYWIEPNIVLNDRVNFYIGTGVVHDVDMANGKTDHPVIVGFKFHSGPPPPTPDE